MQTSSPFDPSIRQPLERWCRSHRVDLLVLFGSQAGGPLHPESDVDLAAWVDEIPGRRSLRWIGELEGIFGRRVDLVLVTDRLDPVLGLEICRSGVVVHAQRPDQWPERRAWLWHRYNDALPFLRAEREELRRFAREVGGGS